MSHVYNPNIGKDCQESKRQPKLHSELQAGLGYSVRAPNKKRSSLMGMVAQQGFTEKPYLKK